MNSLFLMLAFFSLTLSGCHKEGPTAAVSNNNNNAPEELSGEQQEELNQEVQRLSALLAQAWKVESIELAKEASRSDKITLTQLLAQNRDLSQQGIKKIILSTEFIDLDFTGLLTIKLNDSLENIVSFLSEQNGIETALSQEFKERIKNKWKVAKVDFSVPVKKGQLLLLEDLYSEQNNLAHFKIGQVYFSNYSDGSPEQGFLVLNVNNSIAEIAKYINDSSVVARELQELLGRLKKQWKVEGIVSYEKKDQLERLLQIDLDFSQFGIKQVNFSTEYHDLSLETVFINVNDELEHIADFIRGQNGPETPISQKFKERLQDLWEVKKIEILAPIKLDQMPLLEKLFTKDDQLSKLGIKTISFSDYYVDLDHNGTIMVDASDDVQNIAKFIRSSQAVKEEIAARLNQLEKLWAVKEVVLEAPLSAKSKKQMENLLTVKVPLSPFGVSKVVLANANFTTGDTLSLDLGRDIQELSDFMQAQDEESNLQLLELTKRLKVQSIKSFTLAKDTRKKEIEKLMSLQIDLSQTGIQSIQLTLHYSPLNVGQVAIDVTDEIDSIAQYLREQNGPDSPLALAFKEQLKKSWKIKSVAMYVPLSKEKMDLLQNLFTDKDQLAQQGIKHVFLSNYSCPLKDGILIINAEDDLQKIADFVRAQKN